MAYDPNSRRQSSSQGSSFSNTPSSLQTPASRGVPSSPYDTSQGPPTVPQIATTFYEGAARPTTMSTSHSYSRSSPAASSEQKYTPFSNTPEMSRYTNVSSSKQFIPQTPTGAPSQSPLALTDIRPPRAELHMGDDPTSPTSAQNNEPPILQTNSSYIAPWVIYAYDWCNWPLTPSAGAGKMAVCSYLEDPHNFIQILDTQIDPQDPNGGGLQFSKVAEATCACPITRILWEPPSSQKAATDLLATSGDHLRLWSLPNSSTTPVSNTIHRSSTAASRQSPSQKLTPLALLSNSKTPEHTAPLTSLDWNTVSPKLIITSSIDTTCTIWDIPTLTAKTQLIAHDKEVFDVRFCAGSVDTFVSCGADGSVRMFDLRSLEHSTIIYEPSEKTEKVDPSPSPLSPGSQHSANPAPPLLRIAASPHDSHLLATFAQDSKIIRVLDHRQPGQALLELHGHSASANCAEWSPTRRGMLATGGDDSLVLYWDLINPQNGAQTGGGIGAGVNGINPFGVAPAPSARENGSGAGETNTKGPTASWRSDFEVNNISWSPPSLQGGGDEYLGVTGGRGVWGVRL